MGNSVHPQWLHNWRLISDCPTITEEENQNLVNFVIGETVKYQPRNPIKIQGNINHDEIITSASIKTIRKTANCVLTAYAEDDKKYRFSTISFEMHRDTYFHFGSIGSSATTRKNAELHNWAFNDEWRKTLTDDTIIRLVNFIEDFSQDIVDFRRLNLSGIVHRSPEHPDGEKITISNIISIRRPKNPYTQSTTDHDNSIGERFIAETENHERIELVFTRATVT